MRDSILFSSAWYLERNPDIAEAGLDPYDHFISHGAREGRSPHPLFEPAHYLKFHPAYEDAWGNPLFYYLEQGARQFADPHPLFDTRFYLVSNPDVAAAGVNPLLHYLEWGWREGRDPHPLFHNAWYLNEYPDVTVGSINPLVHWVCHGVHEGRRPNPLFETSFYVAQAQPLGRVNPLAHYFDKGGFEGLNPHPLFNSAYYLKTNPDVLHQHLNPLAHFFAIGAAAGRDPHPFFSISFYRQQAPDVANPLVHYLETGAAQGLDPDPRFDTSFYSNLAGASRESMNPLVHYLLIGRAQGARPHPDFPPDCKPELIDFTAAPVDDLIRLNHTLADVKTFAHQPLISVLLPTFNTPPKLLQLAVNSVLAQVYTKWQLCIHDDGSTSSATLHALEALRNLDQRICLSASPRNEGISRATNLAMKNAEGDFIAMLDHDDELRPDALAEVVRKLNEEPGLDVIYTDQDYIDEDGSFSGHFFKPDWSPHMLRGVMYVGHLLVVRRALAVRIGGFDPAFDFVQDFEFMLRLSEQSSRIAHIPLVLYSWRRIPGSVASGTGEKAGIADLQAAAVNRHLDRMRIAAGAIPNPKLAHRLLIRGFGGTRLPSISVLDAAELPDALCRPAGLGEYVVVRRAGVTVLSRDWLRNLLIYACHDDVAFVSALILESTGLVANAGLIIQPDGEPAAAMRGIPQTADGYAGSLAVAREVTAVSDDCVMVATGKLIKLGLCEDYRTPYFQCLDATIRASRSGLRNIHTPRVVVRRDLLNGESTDILDRALFRETWRDPYRDGDPFYSRNFPDTNYGRAL